MCCDMLKIQDGVTIVKKLNCICKMHLKIAKCFITPIGMRSRVTGDLVRQAPKVRLLSSYPFFTPTYVYACKGLNSSK